MTINDKYKRNGKKSATPITKCELLFPFKELISLDKWAKDYKSQFTERKTAFTHTTCSTSFTTRETHRKTAMKLRFWL